MALMVFNHDHPEFIKSYWPPSTPRPMGKKKDERRRYLLSHRVELNHQPHRSQENQRFYETRGILCSYELWVTRIVRSVLSLRDRHSSMMVAGNWCCDYGGGGGGVH
ncbi:hypothetical protein IMY05_010G0105100 [Salix suchowensis]|nr:hypothetical protein IMY05_010G0105100 [Salix suchowensis]